MKRNLTIALAGLIASVAALNAIPDQVGVFIANSNLRVEDFVFEDDTWSADEFGGEWEPQTATVETREDSFRLKKAFIVFGVRADNVSAVKRDGDLSRFLVTFRPDSKTDPDGDKLIRTLLTNIEAYTGKTLVATGAGGKASAPGYHSRYKDYEIHLGKGARDEVLVAIRRVPA